MSRERELKFSTTSEHVPATAELAPALERAGFELGQPALVQIRDRYFDDARASLARAGLALRRRMAEGRMVATLKDRGTVRDGMHDRSELELPLPQHGWPDAIAERVSVVTDPQSLKPYTVIDTEQCRWAVTREGRSVAVLTFDAVTAKQQHGERTVHFNEVEIEAVGAVQEEELRRIAGAVAEVVPLTPSDTTKLERARTLLLLGGW